MINVNIMFMKRGGAVGIIFSLIFILFAIGILAVYYFYPFTSLEFVGEIKNSNFSLGDNENMQFYSNMRYPNSDISYNIQRCTLKKENDMELALKIIENKTTLNFYPVSNNEEIFVTCDETEKIEDRLFIAGEGGPVNITQTELFNVIFHGKILLIKESDCPELNIAIHELLHALGFAHSFNQNNIMYNVTNCKQTIGDDIINLIDKIYSVQSLPDLSFLNVSATIDGRYLNTKISIRNNGLKKAEKFNLEIYSEDKLVKKFEIDEIDIGYGRKIALENVWVSKMSVDELTYVINSQYEELGKENNKITLKVNRH